MSFNVEPLSEDSLLLRFGERIEVALNVKVQTAANTLRAAKLPGVHDIAPAYASLLLRFDPRAWTAPSNDSGVLPHQKLTEALRTVLGREVPERAGGTANACTSSGVEIPVCYGGDYGPDLAELAERLDMPSEEIIARHTAASYRVAMLGFAPGFPYLLGLDEKLQAPRRATPRTRVPAGSVAIGGAQTGIYPRELPGGWNLIGRTPFALFDARRDPPCLLGPGDQVRFRPITSDEFVSLAERKL